ncbi:hypothetical protein A9W98_14790 [Mycobacterium gordonae]|uniref:Uncharacterized protein n=1 Tax=Mycobacterium gordonae TaxID=1778 RepID=A0A1A6BJJ1_MYCGO|nr:hypothetical protein A9W98_14790 [Mycobacterium gordonae]
MRPILLTCPFAQPGLDAATLQRLGPHVTTSRLEVLLAGSSADEPGERSSASNRTTMTATTTAAKPADTAITATSPRFMMQSSQ